VRPPDWKGRDRSSWLGSRSAAAANEQNSGWIRCVVTRWIGDMAEATQQRGTDIGATRLDGHRHPRARGLRSFRRPA